MSPPARRPLISGARFVALFLPMAAIGTLSHEGGHVLAALAAGCDSTLRYASMDYDCPPGVARDARLWITLGGPAQTALFGTIGLALLARRRPDPLAPTRAGDLAAALLALFWSRELFNALALAGTWSIGATDAAMSRGDEQRLSLALGLPLGSLSVVTGALGLAACLWVVGRLPPDERLPFIVGGVAGSLAGFAIWMGWLGPALLP